MIVKCYFLEDHSQRDDILLLVGPFEPTVLLEGWFYLVAALPKAFLVVLFQLQFNFAHLILIQLVKHSQCSL